MEPLEGIEPPAARLRIESYTAKPQWHRWCIGMEDLKVISTNVPCHVPVNSISGTFSMHSEHVLEYDRIPLLQRGFADECAVASAVPEDIGEMVHVGIRCFKRKV